jgi:RND family efflux transporter MFP subunit
MTAMARGNSLDSTAALRLPGRAALIAFGVLSTLLLGACTAKSATDPRTQAPLVRTTLVHDADAASRSFTGVVAARVQSDLGFRVPGKLLERFVDTGQTVTRGQRLARIDPADLNLAAHAQQEAVVAARALARQTAADEVRYRNLRERGVLSASAHDQAKAAADAAAAQLRAVEAQATVARNASSYATLVADADGVVMETLVEPGQVVGAGQVVVRVAHAGPREAVVQLPETLRPALGSTARATLFGTDGSVSAQLRQLSDVADPLTRTFEARYVLGDDVAHAPLGTTVTIQLVGVRTSAPTARQIPIGALLDAGKGPGVWVISGQPTHVTWRAVTVVRVDDEHAYIGNQIRPGERIVALGAHLLREGEQVRLADNAGSLTASAHP